MGDWQPIETAPKDGRYVTLGWRPNGVTEYQTESHWVKGHVNGHWEGNWTPTHWMPFIDVTSDAIHDAAKQYQGLK
jgi:hypothetical protein